MCPKSLSSQHFLLCVLLATCKSPVFGGWNTIVQDSVPQVLRGVRDPLCTSEVLLHPTACSMLPCVALRTVEVRPFSLVITGSQCHTSVSFSGSALPLAAPLPTYGRTLLEATADHPAPPDLGVVRPGTSWLPCLP